MPLPDVVALGEAVSSSYSLQVCTVTALGLKVSVALDWEPEEIG